MHSQPSVLFLITPTAQNTSDNWQCIPQAFESFGWTVSRDLHDNIYQGDTLLTSSGREVASYDLVWPIGFGPLATFADRCSLLSQLPSRKLITAIPALQNLHAKNRWLKYGPPALVSKHKIQLKEFTQRHQGTWVLKTNAGSFGKDVYFLANPEEIDQLIPDNSDQYWVLQQRVGSTTSDYCETRVLICGEEIVGCYQRSTQSNGLANLSQQGQAQSAELSDIEQTLVQRVMADFAKFDIGFASIDIAEGFLIETNIANPGGLSTLQQVYGDAYYRRACAQLVKGAHSFVQNG